MDLLSEEFLDVLEADYRPVEVPRCRVCGGELTVANRSADNVSYACLSREKVPAHADPLGTEQEKWYQHARESRWDMPSHQGDERVIKMILELRQLRRERA